VVAYIALAVAYIAVGVAYIAVAVAYIAVGVAYIAVAVAYIEIAVNIEIAVHIAVVASGGLFPLHYIHLDSFYNL
jgi:hypothetical protein